MSPDPSGLPSRTIVVPTPGAMKDLGRALAALLRAGDVLVLTGDLGAGKTTFTQGLGEGLGVRGPVTSPTFVIARVHPSLIEGPALIHVDAYRLGSALELDDLDLDADLDAGVTVIEWGRGVAEQLSDDRLELTLGAGQDSEERTVTIVGVGARWAAPVASEALVRLVGPSPHPRRASDAADRTDG